MVTNDAHVFVQCRKPGGEGVCLRWQANFVPISDDERDWNGADAFQVVWNVTLKSTILSVLSVLLEALSSHNLADVSRKFDALRIFIVFGKRDHHLRGAERITIVVAFLITRLSVGGLHVGKDILSVAIQGELPVCLRVVSMNSVGVADEASPIVTDIDVVAEVSERDERRRAFLSWISVPRVQPQPASA